MLRAQNGGFLCAVLRSRFASFAVTSLLVASSLLAMRPGAKRSIILAVIIICQTIRASPVATGEDEGSKDAKDH